MIKKDNIKMISFYICLSKVGSGIMWLERFFIRMEFVMDSIESSGLLNSSGASAGVHL